MEGGCPGGGSSFGHEGEGKSNLFCVINVDFLVGDDVEKYGVEPCCSFFKGSIISFRDTDVKFYWFSSGSGGGHGWWWLG